MKRKPASKILSKSAEDLYKNTDFYKRFSNSLGRGLKDHRYAAEFTLDANKRYSDDPKGERFEIMQDKNGQDHLVFIVSLVKVAYAMDESKYFETVTMNLELRANNLSSFSKVGSFTVSVVSGIFMSALFLGIMYLIFPVLRQTAFVVFTSNGESNYSTISQKESVPELSSSASENVG